MGQAFFDPRILVSPIEVGGFKPNVIVIYGIIRVI